MGTSINTFFERITALRGTRNLAVYCILWLRPLRLTSLRELAYAETLRWFSWFLRSVTTDLMLQHLARLGTPRAGVRLVLHLKLCIYRNAHMSIQC